MTTSTPEARAFRLCPHCYAGTAPEATTCWLCMTQLPAYEERPRNDAEVKPRIAGAPKPTSPRPIELDFIFWVLATVVSTLLLVVLVIDVGYLGGAGYAALATIAVAPVVASLGVMVWVRGPASRAARVRGESKEPTPVTRVLGGVALTVTSVLALIGLIALLVLALLVLAFVACLIAIDAPRF